MQPLLLQKENSSVVVVEPTASIRMMIMEILRGLGFIQVKGVNTGKEAISLLETEDIHWLIMPLSAHEPINGIHVLKLINSEPSLRRTLVTLLLDSETEEYVIPLAFELGLYSWLNKSYVKENLQNDFEELLKISASYNECSTLTSAEYLRKFLTEKKMFASRIALEKNLLAAYPGSAKVLLHLGEVELLLGNMDRAVGLFNQAEMIDERLAPICKIYRSKHSKGEITSGSTRHENVLGLKNAIIIDPDTDVLYALSEILEKLGVKSIQTFEDGQSAFDWVKAMEKEPDLIVMEWRIGILSGPVLVQRIREMGYVQVPIIVASSLIKREEKPLLIEMDVDEILEKPFDSPSFLKVVVCAIQQNKTPTEFKFQNRRFRRLLEAKKVGEAERLLAQIIADPRISDNSKVAVKAEFSFAQGDFQTTCLLAVESLRLGGENLLMLNLLGKAFLKLNQFEKALKCFDKANTLCSINLERLLSIAEINLTLNKPERAIKALEAAEGIDPGHAGIAETYLKIHLESGNLSAASKDLEKIESVPKIASYINNRAIALSRSGRYEDSIALYKHAISCLKDEWTDLAAAVTYNLALAYARYGDYEKAILNLATLDGHRNHEFQKKALSLRKKVQTTEKNGKRLFEEVANDLTFELPAEPSQPAPSLAYWDDLLSKIELKRCDLACYLLFIAVDEHESKALDLLTNLPRFNNRQNRTPNKSQLSGKTET